MKNPTLTRALWACADAEYAFNCAIEKVTKLQQQVDESYDGQFIDVLDEMHATQKRLEALKYDLLICFRAAEK